MKRNFLLTPVAMLTGLILAGASPLVALPETVLIDAILIRADDGSDCLIGRVPVTTPQFEAFTNRKPAAAPSSPADESTAKAAKELEFEVLRDTLEKQFHESVPPLRLNPVPPQPSHAGSKVAWQLAAKRVANANAAMKARHDMQVEAARKKAEEEAIRRFRSGKFPSPTRSANMVSLEDARAYLRAMKELLGPSWQVRLPTKGELNRMLYQLPANTVLNREWLSDGSTSNPAGTAPSNASFRYVLIRKTP